MTSLIPFSIKLPDHLTEGEVTRILLAVMREAERVERTNTTLAKRPPQTPALIRAIKAVQKAEGADELFDANEKLYEAITQYLGL